MRDPRVLVAAESPSVRETVAARLGRHGWSTVATTPGDAPAALRTVPPDVVVLDASDPTGAACLEVLRADDARRAIPVVVLVARPDVGWLDSGAHDQVGLDDDDAALVARVQAAARTGALWAELARRNADLERFTRAVSHDLKSPLTIVAGMAQTLALRWERLDADARNRLLDRIAGAAQRAADMVTDLSRLARATGVVPVPDAMVADAEAIVRTVLDERGLTGAAEVGGEWLPVAIDPDALTVVVDRLADNARRWGCSADGVLRLSVTATSVADGLCVTVADRGPGVGDDDLRLLFEPFTRSAAAAEAHPDGSGVGLAIARRTAERWGGSLTYEPGPGGGAVFRLTLPLAT